MYSTTHAHAVSLSWVLSLRCLAPTPPPCSWTQILLLTHIFSLCIGCQIRSVAAPCMTICLIIYTVKTLTSAWYALQRVWLKWSPGQYVCRQGQMDSEAIVSKLALSSFHSPLLTESQLISSPLSVFQRTSSQDSCFWYGPLAVGSYYTERTSSGHISAEIYWHYSQNLAVISWPD